MHALSWSITKARKHTHNLLSLVTLLLHFIYIWILNYKAIKTAFVSDWKVNTWYCKCMITYLLIYLLTHSLSHTPTHSLTPWSRVLLEKLTDCQLVKKFPPFHGTWRFITALTSACHPSLSWTRSIQSPYPHIPLPDHPS